MLCKVQGAAKQDGNQRAQHCKPRHAQQHPALQRGRGHEEVGGLYAHAQRNGIGHQRRHQAGQKIGVVDDANADHHHGKDRRGQRRAKQRGKQRRHARHGRGTQVAVIQMQQTPGVIADGTAHLQRRALASGGTTAQVG